MIAKDTNTRTYLKLIGVPNLPPLTSPFDPGYDPATLDSEIARRIFVLPRRPG